MEVHYHPKALQAGKDNNKIEPMKKIISFMHISLDGFEDRMEKGTVQNKNYEFRMMNYEIVIHHPTFITLNSKLDARPDWK